MKSKKQLFKFLALYFSISSIIYTQYINTSHSQTPELSPSSICTEITPLALVIMVKNEESGIIPTLKSYIEGGIKHILVFDTGSFDTTIEKTQNYFKKINLEHGYIIQEKYIASVEYPEFPYDVFRNKGLEYAEKQFPYANFFLMVDAEWYLENGPQLLEFCNKEAYASCPLYMIRIGNASSHFYTPRLIRSSSKIRFAGDVHETPTATNHKKVPYIVFIEKKTHAEEMEKSRVRWACDKVKLLKRYEKNPQDSRTLFYLAQTFECLNDLENAQKYYLLRCDLQGWDEENYMALYRLAVVTQAIAEKKENPDYTLALSYFDKAHTMRPTRVEPLVRSGQIYWNMHQFTTAFVFAKRAFELPYPESEVLTMENSVYNFERYELMSKVSWHLKEYELGEKATRKVLEYITHEPQYYRNLAAYLEGIRTQKMLKALKSVK